MTTRKDSLFSAGGAELPKIPRALRILMADDDRDAVLTLIMLLRDEGHEVRPVDSARNVMSAVIESDPDVVVLDISMPDMSGWQLAQTIRARHEKRPLLIGISGVFMKGPDKIFSRLSGFDHYLLKPYPPTELLKLLEPLRNMEQRRGALEDF